MEVQFREFNPFNVWIWLEFETVPAPMERQYLEEVFNSWFYLGKLGDLTPKIFRYKIWG